MANLPFMGMCWGRWEEPLRPCFGVKSLCRSDLAGSIFLSKGLHSLQHQLDIFHPGLLLR